MSTSPTLVPVLMYHSVGSVMPGGLEHLSVPPQQLAEQLHALQLAGYQLLGLTSALAAAEAGQRAVGLTFDDGFVDFLEPGLDVLRAAGAAATLYVPTRALGRTATWLPQDGEPLPVMSAAQVAEVAAAGIEIGSHGAEHVPMDVLPIGTAAAHLRESRAALEDVIGAEVTSFCYPHGYHSRRLRREVRASGYRTACAIGHRRHRLPGQPLAVQRLHVGPEHDAAAVVRLVDDGAPALVPSVKRIATPAWRAARWAALRTAGVTWT